MDTLGSSQESMFFFSPGLHFGCFSEQSNCAQKPCTYSTHSETYNTKSLTFHRNICCSEYSPRWKPLRTQYASIERGLWRPFHFYKGLWIKANNVWNHYWGFKDRPLLLQLRSMWTSCMSHTCRRTLFSSVQFSPLVPSGERRCVSSLSTSMGHN